MLLPEVAEQTRNCIARKSEGRLPGPDHLDLAFGDESCSRPIRPGWFGGQLGERRPIRSIAALTARSTWATGTAWPKIFDLLLLLLPQQLFQFGFQFLFNRIEFLLLLRSQFQFI